MSAASPNQTVGMHVLIVDHLTDKTKLSGEIIEWRGEFAVIKGYKGETKLDAGIKVVHADELSPASGIKFFESRTQVAAYLAVRACQMHGNAKQVAA